MTRYELLPTRTPDGRHIIFRLLVLSPLERLRRMIARVAPN
jgi:hypothetical protein